MLTYHGLLVFNDHSKYIPSDVYYEDVILSYVVHVQIFEDQYIHRDYIGRLWLDRNRISALLPVHRDYIGRVWIFKTTHGELFHFFYQNI